MIIVFTYTNKRGVKFWLHSKIGRGGTILYYFSKDSRDAISKPSGYVVVESPTTSLPVLKRAV